MTKLQAALGLAQLQLEEFIKVKMRIAIYIKKLLRKLKG